MSDESGIWKRLSSFALRAIFPYATSSFINTQVIHITIQHQDQCLAPCLSSLHIQGQVTQSNGLKLKPGTTLVNNAICHLFSEIRYKINAVEIDKNKNVGITTFMKTYPSASSNQTIALKAAGWDSLIIDDNGYFDVQIQLSMFLINSTLPKLNGSFLKLCFQIQGKQVYSNLLRKIHL